MTIPDILECLEHHDIKNQQQPERWREDAAAEIRRLREKLADEKKLRAAMEPAA